jgi:tetratricopeptide (TPR) repeat protein
LPYVLDVTKFNWITRMKKSIALALLIGLAVPGQLPGQLSPYYDFQYLYNDALELFEKEKYSAAIARAEAFLASERNLRNQTNNDLQVNALFIQAMSALKLDRTDAVGLTEAFLREHGENSKAPQASFSLGGYYFNKDQHRKAIGPLSDAWSSGALRREQNQQAVFWLGYSYLMEENHAQAVRFFEIASNNPNPFQEDASYFRSVIFYKDKEYEEAYLAFQGLRNSPKYGKEVKVYLANTLLKLRRYDELNQLADELVAGPKLQGQEAQVYYVVANAGFERNDYARTNEYFNEYVKARGKMSRSDYFRHGFSQYKLRSYREAVPNLERAVGAPDSLSQMASYYLGFCYIESKDPTSAKLAFQKAAQGGPGSKPAISEDALYQLGKISFLTGDYTQALEALTQYTQRYPRGTYVEEAQSMIGESYLYSRNYPQAIAYFESIPRNTSRLKKAYQTVCFYYGLQLLEQSGYDQALGRLRKAVDNPHDPDMALSARYWSAEAQFRQGDFRTARGSWETYLRSPGVAQNEFAARAHYGIGWTYFKEKNYAAALKSFDDYLSRAGANEPKTPVVDANLRAGDCAFVQKNYARANSYYQKAAAMRFAFQDYAAYQIAEGNFRQRQYESAVQAFDQLANNFRNSELRDNALDRISDIYLNWIRNNNLAARYAQTLVNEYPRSPLAAAAYIRLAVIAYDNGDEAQTIQYFKKVLSDYGRDQQNTQTALDNLSQLLPPDEFDRVLRDFRNQNPQSGNNLGALVFNTAKSRFYDGNYSAAADGFSNYIREYRNGASYLEALFLRGRSYRELRQFPRALEDFAAVYSTPSVNDFTLNALQEAGEIKFETRDYNGSLELYRSLLQLSGRAENRATALFGMADNLEALARYDQAIESLIQIAENNDVEVFARTKASVAIGRCQYKGGRLSEAFETYAEVERNFKNEFGAESQYMIAQIQLDEGRRLKAQGDAARASAKFQGVRDAAIYANNTYPTYNYWKAKTFLVAADAYYEMGNVFQAKGTLESLAKEERFPDIQQAARERLARIQAEEGNRN